MPQYLRLDIQNYCSLLTIIPLCLSLHIYKMGIKMPPYFTGVLKDKIIYDCEALRCYSHKCHRKDPMEMNNSLARARAG